MILKTTALALRVEPYSKTSHVVTWLAPDAGRFATLAKGVQRRRSPLQGQFDLFYTCEVLYYARAPRGLHVLHECTALEPRPGFREDWRKAAAASYLCDLVGRLGTPGPGHESLYRLVARVLDDWAARPPTPATVVWAELHVLEASGFAPRLDRCAACGGAVELAPPPPFAFARGGLLCPRCARGDEGPRAMAPPDVLAMLRAWQRAETPEMTRRTACRPAQDLAATRLIGGFLRYHLDPAPPGRDIALGLLRAGNEGYPGRVDARG